MQRGWRGKIRRTEAALSENATSVDRFGPVAWHATHASHCTMYTHTNKHSATLDAIKRLFYPRLFAMAKIGTGREKIAIKF